MTLKNLVKFALYINDENMTDLADDLNTYQSALSEATSRRGNCPAHLKKGISNYTEKAILNFLKELLPKWAFSTERKGEGLRIYVKKYISHKWKEIDK